jgi:glutamine amidotransferase-like uncharacterized protein
MRGKIALFLHHPRASLDSGNGVIAALSPYYEFKIFTKHVLEKSFFHDVSMVAFPGGVGDADGYDTVMRHNAPAIRRFVARGGRYLGICMGAYWADRHYFNLLDGVESQQYIKRPGTDTRRPHAKAISVTWENHKHRMYFYDGTAFVGDRSKFRTVATYANGDPMAIIQNNIGLIGCHPESELHWYNQYRYMTPHWHYNQHHRLLLDFVDNLMHQ